MVSPTVNTVLPCPESARHRADAGVAGVAQKLLQQLYIGGLVVHNQDAGVQDVEFGVHAVFSGTGGRGDFVLENFSARSRVSMNSLIRMGLVR